MLLRENKGRIIKLHTLRIKAARTPTAQSSWCSLVQPRTQIHSTERGRIQTVCESRSRHIEKGRRIMKMKRNLCRPERSYTAGGRWVRTRRMGRRLGVSDLVDTGLFIFFYSACWFFLYIKAFVWLKIAKGIKPLGL